jgi:hypothetical protein
LRPVILQPLLNGGAAINTTCNLPLLQKVGHLLAEGQQFDSKRRRDFCFGFATATGHDRGLLPGWPTWKPVAEIQMMALLRYWRKLQYNPGFERLHDEQGSSARADIECNRKPAWRS